MGSHHSTTSTFPTSTSTSSSTTSTSPPVTTTSTPASTLSASTTMTSTESSKPSPTTSSSDPPSPAPTSTHGSSPSSTFSTQHTGGTSEAAQPTSVKSNDTKATQAAGSSSSGGSASGPGSGSTTSSGSQPHSPGSASAGQSSSGAGASSSAAERQGPVQSSGASSSAVVVITSTDSRGHISVQTPASVTEVVATTLADGQVTSITTIGLNPTTSSNSAAVIHQNSFWNHKGAVAGVFVAIALVIVGGTVAVCLVLRRRRRSPPGRQFISGPLELGGANPFSDPYLGTSASEHSWTPDDRHTELPTPVSVSTPMAERVQRQRLLAGAATATATAHVRHSSARRVAPPRFDGPSGDHRSAEGSVGVVPGAATASDGSDEELTSTSAAYVSAHSGTPDVVVGLARSSSSRSRGSSPSRYSGSGHGHGHGHGHGRRPSTASSSSAANDPFHASQDTVGGGVHAPVPRPRPFIDTRDLARFSAASLGSPPPIQPRSPLRSPPPGGMRQQLATPPASVHEPFEALGRISGEGFDDAGGATGLARKYSGRTVLNVKTRPRSGSGSTGHRPLSDGYAFAYAE